MVQYWNDAIQVHLAQLSPMAGVWRCVSVDRSHIRHQVNDSDTGDQGTTGE